MERLQSTRALVLFRHQEHGSHFLNGFLPLKLSDSSFQFLDFLLLRRQRFTLQSNTGALLLKLINPAAQRGLDHTKRAAGFDMAIALIEHEACGLAFEFSEKGTTLFGHQAPLSGEHSRLNGCPASLDHYTLVRSRT